MFWQITTLTGDTAMEIFEVGEAFVYTFLQSAQVQPPGRGVDQHGPGHGHVFAHYLQLLLVHLRARKEGEMKTLEDTALLWGYINNFCYSSFSFTKC